MKMNYTSESLSQGRINQQKAKETPNSFAMQDGVLSLIHI